MKLIIFFEKYGFLLILLYCAGIVTPDFQPKIEMMSQDLGAITLSKSGGNLLKQLFWSLFFLFYSIRYFFFHKRLGDNYYFNRLLKYLLVICCFAFLSVFWSSFPSISMKRVVFQLFFCFSVVISFYYSCYHRAYKKTLECAVFLVFLFIMISFIIGVAFDYSGSLTAYSKGKNVLGASLSGLILLLMMFMVVIGVQFRYAVYILALLFICLLLTQSKTNIATILLILPLIYFRNLASKLTTSTLLLTSLIGFIVMPIFSHALGDIFHLGLVIEPEAITGRGDIWETLYYDLIFFDKLYWGYGYASFFGVPEIPYFFDDPYSFKRFIASAHNGYLELFIQFGGIGASIVFALFIFYFKPCKEPVLWAVLLLPIIQNLTESTFFKDLYFIWFFSLVVFTFYALLEDRILYTPRELK